MRTFLVLSMAILSTSCRDRGAGMIPPAVSVPDQAKHRATIRTQAEDMQKKYIRGDLDGFMPYVHRDVVAMLGGPDKARANMASDQPSIAKTIVKCTLGEVSEVVDDGGRFVAFVPVETTYRYPTGGMLQKTYRIACSEDAGKTWTFMDGQGDKEQEAFFRKKFPGLTQRFPFPPCSHD